MSAISARVAWLVYRKELRETLRDRRTLIVMVLLPLALYPLVGVGVTQWIGAHRAAREERPSRVGLAGPRWPALERALAAKKNVRIEAGAAEAAVRRGSLDALVAVPAGHERRLAAAGTVELGLVYDETRDDSSLARDRVRACVEALAAELSRERLRARALPPTLTTPLATRERSTARPREVGAHVLSGVLPLMIVLMVLLGAFYPAIDLTAGEKERGTLETLFTTPAPRTALVAGKFLTVATVAAATGVLNLGSIGLTFALGFGPALRAAGFTGSLVPWSAVALTAVALVPASLFFAALMTAVAALARSFKEAQNLLTPVYIACMLPALVAQLPGFALTPGSALIPVANIALLTRELIAGRAAALTAALALASTLCYAALALRIAARIWSSERLLFAPDVRHGAARARARRALPQPGEAALLLLGVMALMLLVGNPLQVRSLIGGILATEWLLIALPVLALVRLAGLDPRSALGLRPSSTRGLLGALLAGLSGWYLVGVVVEGVQQRFLPMPPQLLDEIKRTLFSTARPLAVDLFALAISPAICEELLFRGVLLRASWPALRLPAAVALNATLFALFHLSIYRFLPTLLLGAALAVIAIRSGSILPAMLFHLLNNGVALVVGRGLDPAAVAAQSGLSAQQLAAAAVALAVFVVGIWLVWRSTPGPSGPRDR